ncbi:MAG TPA: phosphoribosylformylglycinamidine synthase subunit PurL [Ktedonobacteraceae bacterium]|nr:phosphoribosylformylglycinamidine synthase subunit PurL [Ktedonobacteraceae bacterium]
MTTLLIEVEAVSQEYDAQANKLAREILFLPIKHLPSLAAIATGNTPLTLRTAHLYYLTGNLSLTEIDRLAQQLLADPVMQKAHISTSSVKLTTHQEQYQEQIPAYIIDVFFHAGVTDTLAESVMNGASLLDIRGLEQVATGKRYILDGRLSETDVQYITEALLYNPVIQQYSLHRSRQEDFQTGDLQDVPAGRSQAQVEARTSANRFHILDMTDEELLELSKAGMLALDLEEMRAIQAYYREQQREPTDVELETLAQTWSEHCSHKSFKATIDYYEVDSAGTILKEETIDGLLKQYIMHATEQINPPWLVSAFSDNAGIIRFTRSHDIAFKVETHNHPSAIEPFGGANTGIGGVIRDVLGVSAQPIACTDVLCFGTAGTVGEDLPPGILSPHRIANGVVDGIRDYGNKMGIPTVNGAVLYDRGYLYNPLVFCGCLGVLPHGGHPRRVRSGDLIVVLGGRTGRDGIHGATFSSGEMSRELSARAGSAVQIGAPITEKKVTDVLIQARDRHLYTSITDCGAGGFSSAIGEMGEETGARVELANVPLKYAGLAPWEIWLSEAQERMVLAVPPDHLTDLLEICTLEEVEASVIGSFTGDKRLVVSYHGEVVADLDMVFLHKGRPRRRLEATWTGRQETPISASNFAALKENNLSVKNHSGILLALLCHPTIASKEAIIRRYDHEVQGATVLKPLVGKAGNGPGDAVVLQPILDEPTGAGIVISNGINPLYGRIDPYAMATNAIDEALRNLTAVGGDIEHAAILDNFCWGNPTDPVQLGMLVRAAKGCHDAAIGFRVPFISGKDSLNNEYRTSGQRLPVLPTLLISAAGVIDDAARTIDMSLKDAGNLLYQIGITRNELGGSYLAEVVESTTFEPSFPQTNVPQVDFQAARTRMKALGNAIRAGMIVSCHDLSEGGLAVASAEMALAGSRGIHMDIGKARHDISMPEDSLATLLLFSESASRFLVEVVPEQQHRFEAYMRSQGVRDFACIGEVTESDRFIVQYRTQKLVDLPVATLQSAWRREEVKA